MIKIGICEDEKLFLDYLEDKIKESFNCEEKSISIYKFNDATDLIESYEKDKSNFNIILLDINMPKLNGIEAAKLIREKDEEVILIFITSVEYKVYQTFEYNVFRFIRKSHIDIELEEALESAVEKFKKDKYIFKTTIGHIELDISEIICFEFYERVVHIKTFSNTYKTTIRRFKDIEDRFLLKGFVIIYRGTMINVKYIKNIGTNEIILDNGEKMYISRYRIEEVKKAFITSARRGK